ncbi:MAG: hypothetical protein HQ494_07790 [Rhodospirillales bacterium]|nr:hypothetical protein [Rhodospirillales bacterium]
MENQHQTGQTGLAIIAVLASVALVHAAWWWLSDSVVAHGNLVDSDGYARLVRVLRLVETGDWFNVSLPRANWPYGGSLHWTRPLDVLLIGLALPMATFVGFAKALFWAGVLISPLLHGLAAVTLMWAARPLIGAGASVVAGMLSAVAFGVLGYATIGHADHHVLVGLVAVAAFGFTLRALVSPGDAARHALSAGWVLAFGVWVGTEIQVTAGLCFGVAALKWAVQDGGGGLAVNRRMALGFLLGLIAALVIERGPGVWTVQYDRLSIVHVTLGALIFGLWSALGFAPLKRAWARLAAGAIGGGVIFAGMVALFPKVLVSPLIDVAPVMLEIFASVAEYAPVPDPWHFLVYAGGVILALPWAVMQVVRSHEPERWGWLLLVAGLVVYTLFAVNWIRWSLYVGLFSTVALAHMMMRAEALFDDFAPAVRVTGKVWLLLLIAVGPFAVGMAGIASTSSPAGTREFVDGDPRPCPVQAMSRFLNRAPWGDRPRMILASANDGAELLYRTPHRVMGTLHHPNTQGIIDSIRILSGTDDFKTLALMRQRRVDLVLVCRRWGGDAYRAVEGNLYQRLLDGDAPGWLAEVALPEVLGTAFRLYTVAEP